MDKYRVRAKCDNCYKQWITRAKKKRTAPTRCKYCHSIRVKVLNYWKIKG